MNRAEAAGEVDVVQGRLEQRLEDILDQIRREPGIGLYLGVAGSAVSFSMASDLRCAADLMTAAYDVRSLD
jgi:hypothetical protein